jgi:uncharacterized membrane protein (Fun14 family)
MSIPPELAWLVPIIAPFIIGLLAGFIVKRTLKLVLAVVALVTVFIVTGYAHLTFEDLWSRAMDFLPRLVDLGGGIRDVLPYSSVFFLLGLVLGLWKG